MGTRGYFSRNARHTGIAWSNCGPDDAPPAAQDNLVVFASQKELSKATAEWPVSRLVETWNSFAGTPGFDDLKPVKKFENRAKATTRIWAVLELRSEEHTSELQSP